MPSDAEETPPASSAQVFQAAADVVRQHAAFHRQRSQSSIAIMAGTGMFRLTASGTLTDGTPQERPSVALLQAVLERGERTTDGDVILAVTTPWFEIVEAIDKDPGVVHQLSWQTWEDLIAGAYKREGFEVIKRPRSNDHGIDIIAIKPGMVSVKVFDQVKHYKPGLRVRANDVLAMIGLLQAQPNVSMGVITTTSDFAPGVYKRPDIQQLVPHRILLRPISTLLRDLKAASQK
jgi:restriction system protein